MSAGVQRGLFEELDSDLLFFTPAKLCDKELEKVKISKARVYYDLTLWSLSVLKAICKPWEEAVKAQNKDKIESEASYIL